MFNILQYYNKNNKNNENKIKYFKYILCIQKKDFYFNNSVFALNKN